MPASQLLQSGAGTVRGTIRLAERVTRRVVSEGYGVTQKALHLGREPKPGMDDVTIAHKVETEIFRGPDSPKQTVNVNVVDGVVWLRGEVKNPEQVSGLEEKARSVPEVRNVENLLHLAKTPAPTRADAPARQQRTRSSTRRPTPSRRRGGRVSDDRTDAIAPEAEPSPAEHARQGKGRTAAPMGSADQEAGPATGSADQEAGPPTGSADQEAGPDTGSGAAGGEST